MVILLYSFIFPPALSALTPLIFSTPGEPPYHYDDQSGLIDQWVKEALKRIGLEVRIEWQPPERGLQNANAGVIDGDAARIGGITKEYQNLVQVSEKLMESEFVAFTKNLKFNMTGWDSLKPYNVAIVRGHKISEANVIGTRSLVKARNAELLMSLLNENRVDVAVCERRFGSMAAKKLDPQITALEPPLAKLDFYIYLHKKHNALASPLANALRDMKRDGTYQRILRHAE